RLTHTQMALDNINNQLQIANETNGQMLNQYTSLCNKINARCGDTQQDRQSFITPTDTTISNKVQEIVGGYSDNVNERWGDYERLYRWVVNNMDYSYDTYTPYLPSSLSGAFEWRKDFWRMPAETLADETGDCEDMALLLASMMKNYNQGKFAVWVIEIASGVPGNPSHLAVAIPVQDGRLTILDPAGKYYTGMYQYSSLYSESAATATNAWISYWSKEIPAAFVERIFSESEEHQFSSTSEFLAWLNQRY
ncbi:MAG TPA: transglutaminase-like domain-containing protein, partial [Dehalococcoidales bacterium]